MVEKIEPSANRRDNSREGAFLGHPLPIKRRKNDRKQGRETTEAPNRQVENIGVVPASATVLVGPSVVVGF